MGWFYCLVAHLLNLKLAGGVDSSQNDSENEEEQEDEIVNDATSHYVMTGYIYVKTSSSTFLYNEFPCQADIRNATGSGLYTISKGYSSPYSMSYTGNNQYVSVNLSGIRSGFTFKGVYYSGASKITSFPTSFTYTSTSWSFYSSSYYSGQYYYYLCFEVSLKTANIALYSTSNFSTFTKTSGYSVQVQYYNASNTMTSKTITSSSSVSVFPDSTIKITSSNSSTYTIMTSFPSSANIVDQSYRNTYSVSGYYNLYVVFSTVPALRFSYYSEDVSTKPTVDVTYTTYGYEQTLAELEYGESYIAYGTPYTTSDYFTIKIDTFGDYLISINSEVTEDSENEISFYASNGISEANIYVCQKYTIYYDSNGGSGSKPSNYYRLHGGDSVTIQSNKLTREGFTASNWNTRSDGSGTDYVSGQSYSGNSNITLYAKWIGKQYTVSFNSHGGSSVANITVTMGKAYGTLPTPTRSDCVLEGWYLDSSFTKKVTSSTIVATAKNHTLYAKWKENGANVLKYDSTGKYWYFEDGRYPQSYVGTSMNNTLNKASLTQSGRLSYNNGSGTSYIYVYTYNNVDYARLQATSTQTLKMSDGTSYTFTKNNWYWFEVEPIRWRVSDYGVSSSSYPSGWSSYGAYNKSFTVVSDRVLAIGLVETDKVSEGWAFTSSELYTLTSNLNKTNLSDSEKKNNFTVDLGHCLTNASSTYYQFGNVGQISKINNVTKTETGLRVASTEEIDDYLTDYSAKASDMVCFLLGCGTDDTVDYWTRNLGAGLNNGEIITEAGSAKSNWFNKVNGIRFAMTMEDGHRI